MIVLTGERFRIAGFHQRQAPEESAVELKQGLVVTVTLEFQYWLGGRSLVADAFFDPGADHSMISSRWIREQVQKPRSSVETPRVEPDGLLLERVDISIGDWAVPLGNASCPVWLFDQDDELEATGTMPGYEDVLVGRDFLCQHDLLVVIDGHQRRFSILAPIDAENQDRRSRILGEFYDSPVR